MADVFISYARADETRVELVVRALEAHGVSVWWDRSLEQGAGFAALIRDEIAQAKAVIVCWSEAAAASRWVQSEADEADHQKKYVGVLIAPGRAPPPFNTVNNANLQAWTGTADDRQLLALLNDIGRRIGRDDIARLAAAEETRHAEEERKQAAAVQAERVRLERERYDERERALRARVSLKRRLFFFGGPIATASILGALATKMGWGFGASVFGAAMLAVAAFIASFIAMAAAWRMQLYDTGEEHRSYLGGGLMGCLWVLPVFAGVVVIGVILFSVFGADRLLFGH